MQNPRMTMLACFFTLMNLAPMLSADPAQEMLPELAAPAAKHKAATEALDKQKLEAIAGAAKSYVAALDLIEKSATAKGEIDLVAEVVKEREAAASGTLEPTLPAALPKARLQMSRKTLLSSIERINTDFAKRRKQADAEYLRALASLDAKAASNPELAKQVAAEKDALLQGGVGSGGSVSGGAAAKVTRGKNVVVNGDFEKIVDGKPEGWSLNTDCMTIRSENGNTFIRFEDQELLADGTVRFGNISREIDMPKGSGTVQISSRLRTNACVSKSTKKPNLPQVSVAFLDADKKYLGFVTVNWGTQNGGWKMIQGEGNVRRGTVITRVSLTNGHCPGQIDFDDIEVTFK